MITIRTATVEDIPHIQNVLVTTWQDTYTWLPDSIKQAAKEQWHTAENLKRQIEWEKSIFLIAKDNDKIVGLLHASKQELEKVSLHKLYVLPAEQGKHIGTELFNTLLKLQPEYVCVSLEVEKKNEQAIRFYKKMGFVIVEEKNAEVGAEKIEEYIMKKENS